ncbi:MAG: sigma-70 family RNA polymerase sigma factor [Oscillospiraceae bacterium]|nr:sigma-70 family RNA polymerase sigma factor [Oscillospiraceae bacterium]
MTKKEYAVVLYCQVFRVEDDGGDAYIQGIQDALGTLTEREQLMLKARFRYGKTYAQIGKSFGVSKSTARSILLKAMCKLRHPYRSRLMSVAKLADGQKYRRKTGR